MGNHIQNIIQDLFFRRGVVNSCPRGLVKISPNKMISFNSSHIVFKNYFDLSNVTILTNSSLYCAGTNYRKYYSEEILEK